MSHIAGVGIKAPSIEDLEQRVKAYEEDVSGSLRTISAIIEDRIERLQHVAGRLTCIGEKLGYQEFNDPDGEAPDVRGICQCGIDAFNLLAGLATGLDLSALEAAIYQADGALHFLEDAREELAKARAA